MDKFKELADKIREQNRIAEEKRILRDIEKQHFIPLLDFTLVVLIILLAIVVGKLFVKLIV